MREKEREIRDGCKQGEAALCCEGQGEGDVKQSRGQLGLDFDVQGGQQRERESLSSACAVD